jgi:hypothetical protein
MNVPGLGARSIYICPLDGKNLNRVFPGNVSGTASEQIAGWMFQNVMKQADYYVDLHGGDLIEALVPFTIIFRCGNEQVDQASMEMANVFGIRYLVCSETPGSTYATTTRAGIPSILAESGGQGLWSPEDVARLTNGVNRLMHHLKMTPGPTPKPVPCTLLDQEFWLRSDHDGFWYPAVSVGDRARFCSRSHALPMAACCSLSRRLPSTRAIRFCRSVHSSKPINVRRLVGVQAGRSRFVLQQNDEFVRCCRSLMRRPGLIPGHPGTRGMSSVLCVHPAGQ